MGSLWFLTLRTYDDKIKSHWVLYDFHILNIWISKEHMPPPNPKPSASFLIHYLARIDEFSRSFIAPHPYRLLDEFSVSMTIYELARQLMTVLLPNVLLFGCPQSKLITIQLLQISVWSQQTSGSLIRIKIKTHTHTDFSWRKQVPRRTHPFLFLCLGGGLPGPQRSEVPPIIAVALELSPETAVQS